MVETERLGFGGAWLPEHHLAADDYLPSPMVVLAGNRRNGSERRSYVEWVHSVQDAASIVREYIKWDDNPGSLGTGGTAGVDGLSLPTVSRPELEIVASGGRAISSIGTAPPATERNKPLRSRSARMIWEMGWGALSSPRKRSSEIGSWVAPMPAISTRNCARAGSRFSPPMAARAPSAYRLFHMCRWVMPVHAEKFRRTASACLQSLEL